MVDLVPATVVDLVPATVTNLATTKKIFSVWTYNFVSLEMQGYLIEDNDVPNDQVTLQLEKIAHIFNPLTVISCRKVPENTLATAIVNKRNVYSILVVGLVDSKSATGEQIYTVVSSDPQTALKRVKQKILQESHLRTGFCTKFYLNDITEELAKISGDTDELNVENLVIDDDRFILEPTALKKILFE